jgi:hypothetical protein
VRLDGLRLADIGCDPFPSGEMRRDLQQRLRRIHGCVFHQCGFGGVRLWQDESAAAVHGTISHRQRAAYRTQLAGQRKLPGVFVFGKFVGGDLSSGGKDAKRDGQIETPAFLGQIGGSEIDGDAARRKIELTILQRGAHAILAFFDLGFRQTHDGEVGQAVGDVHLDGDQSRFHS